MFSCLSSDKTVLFHDTVRQLTRQSVTTVVCLLPHISRLSLLIGEYKRIFSPCFLHVLRFAINSDTHERGTVEHANKLLNQKKNGNYSDRIALIFVNRNYVSTILNGTSFIIPVRFHSFFPSYSREQSFTAQGRIRSLVRAHRAEAARWLGRRMQRTGENRIPLTPLPFIRYSPYSSTARVCVCVQTHKFVAYIYIFNLQIALHVSPNNYIYMLHVR